jgi:hypothetical protein
MRGKSKQRRTRLFSSLPGTVKEMSEASCPGMNTGSTSVGMASSITGQRRHISFKTVFAPPGARAHLATDIHTRP